MGFFNSKRSSERKAFRSIVEKKTTQAARQAFSDEAIKVAGEKARARARRKSIGEIVAERVRGNIEKRAAGRTTLIPRASPKRIVIKRKASPKRRIVRRRASPKRRTVRRRVTKRITTTSSPTPTVQRTPSNLNEAMFGGY